MFTQPLHTLRMQRKVNFIEAEHFWFEFRVFLFDL